MHNKLSQIWQELRRRKVLHTIVVYASASFVIIELINNVYETLNLPESTPAITLIILAAGFPLAIIFSWIFDLTPKGLEKTKPLEDSQDRTISPVSNSWKIATYVSLVIIVGLVVFNIFTWNGSRNSLLNEISSIAVLPFVDMSPLGDQEYFCDGISEEIINSLAQLGNLKVISRTSAFSFKGKNEDVRDIGKKLNVKTILEGSVRKEESRLRITAQLINTSDGSHIWSQNFDRELISVFDIQDEIALAIVDNLKINLIGKERESILHRYTNNLDAYNLYLQGIFNRELLTPEGIQNSMKYFEQAIEIDPEFALAYVDMAQVYAYLSFGLLSPQIAVPKISEYLNAALEINDKIPKAYRLLGEINMNNHWNWEESEKNYKKAIELNPNNAASYANYAILLTYLGRNEEALKISIKAQELDPMSTWPVFTKGWAYYHTSQFKKAIDVFESVVERDQSALIAQYYLGLAYMATSNHQKAVDRYEKLYDYSADVRTMAVLINSYYEAGEKGKGDSLFHTLAPSIEKEYISPSLLYLIFKARGESDLAYNWYKEAVDQREGWIIWMYVDPFERERIPDEPRYEELANIIGLGQFLEKE